MSLKKYIQSLRKFRVLHRFVGTGLAIFLVISAITGIFLSWKKDIALLQPPTQKGVTKNLAEWKSMAELYELGKQAFYKKYPDQKGNEVDRMDARPSKGVVKIIFENGYWEVQLDAKTGALKSIGRRHSDWIEALHDGSIIGKLFKLVSMNVLGLGLLFLIVTGLWLWYGPKRYRSLRKGIRREGKKG